jgi:tetratricopeptide (TPR) repeat protein
LEGKEGRIGNNLISFQWWGVALRCLEDIKLKSPDAEALARVNAHEALIFLDIGYLNFTNKRNKHALIAYRSSIDSQPTAQGYWRLGELYYTAREMQSARENLSFALEMGGPGMYVMYDQKDVDFCIKPISDVLQFQKVSGFRVDLLAGYLLANVYQNEDNPDVAEGVVSHLRELVMSMPCALSYYILGCAYMDLHNDVQAIAAFHEGLSLRCAASLACAIRFCLAYVHETLDQYDEAEACYTAIAQTDLSIDPQSKKSKRTDIGVILRMGQAQYFQGKRSLALQTFERITNDPYLATLNQKIPNLDQEQAEHLVQGFRLADINHQIGLAYPLSGLFLIFLIFFFCFYLFILYFFIWNPLTRRDITTWACCIATMIIKKQQNSYNKRANFIPISLWRRCNKSETIKRKRKEMLLLWYEMLYSFFFFSLTLLFSWKKLEIY